MNKKFKFTVSLIAVLTLVFGLNTFVFAGDNYTILSKGRFVDRKGTDDTSDDTVYFDASDLTTLKDMVETGKTKISSSLNAYPNTNVQSLDTFDNLSTAIDNLTSVPDIYYYDKATEGDSCARYMYENGSYYPCDQNGKKTSTTALSGTITVVTKDDTTEPADGEIQLVKYEQTDAANLSAGYAGYADKSFILGSGSDNISYRNPEKYFDELLTAYSDSIQYFGGTTGLADTNEAVSVTKSFTCPSNGIVIIRATRWTDSTGNGGGNNNLVVKVNGTKVYSNSAGKCVIKVSAGDEIKATQGQKGNASLSCVVASVTGTFIPLE